MSGDRRVHAEETESRDQRVRERAVDRIHGSRSAFGPRHRDGVREIGTVQQRSSAGRTPNHRDPESPASIAVDLAVGLEPSERQRRRFPPIAAQRRTRTAGDLREQRRVRLHLLLRSHGATDLVEETPARDRYSSSTSLRYEAASRSPSSSAVSDISTAKIHPVPYGSWLISSGASFSAGLTSTTTPLSGV